MPPLWPEPVTSGSQVEFSTTKLRMRVNSALGQVGLSQVVPGQVGLVRSRPGPILRLKEFIQQK